MEENEVFQPKYFGCTKKKGEAIALLPKMQIFFVCDSAKRRKPLSHRGVWRRCNTRKISPQTKALPHPHTDAKYRRIRSRGRAQSPLFSPRYKSLSPRTAKRRYAAKASRASNSEDHRFRSSHRLRLSLWDKALLPHTGRTLPREVLPK